MGGEGEDEEDDDDDEEEDDDDLQSGGTPLGSPSLCASLDLALSGCLSLSLDRERLDLHLCCGDGDWRDLEISNVQTLPLTFNCFD